MKLRDYQTRACERVFQGWFDYDSLLVSMATGTGKTAVAGSVVSAWRGETWSDHHKDREFGDRILMLAHREELIWQLVDGVHKWSDEKCSIEKSELRSNEKSIYKSNVVVGSVQTLSQEHRLERFNPAEFGCIIIDECVDGDSLIETGDGTMTLKQAFTTKADRVLTYDGEKAIFKKVTDWMSKGKKKVLEVKVGPRVLRVTANHLFWSNQGWIRADQLKPEDHVLVAHTKNGKRSTKNLSKKHRSVNVVAENKSHQKRQHLSDSSNGKGQDSTLSSSTNTTNVLLSGSLNSLEPKKKLSSEPSSVTVQSASLTPDQRMQEYRQLTLKSKSTGSNIKQKSSLDSKSKLTKTSTTMDMEKRAVDSEPPVFPASMKSNQLSDKMEEKLLRENGSTSSETSDSHGGSVTTDLSHQLNIYSTPKDTISKQTNSSENGSLTTSEKLQSKKREIIPTFAFSTKDQGKSKEGSNDTSLGVCHTSWERVSSIRESREIEVFDLTVEETHCFFANGILVHNCHHAVSPTYLNVLDHFTKSGAKVLGLTATADRHDEISLGKVFDAVAFEYDIVSGIRDGWLSPIRQQLLTIEGLDWSEARGSKDLSAEKIAAIIEEEEMLHKMASPAIACAGDRQTMIFAPSIHSSEMLAELLNRYKPGSAIAVSSKTEDEDREEAVEKYRRGEIQFLVNCMLFTEGFDVPNTSCIIMFRRTESRSLYSQMIGRGIRGGPRFPIPGKEDLLVIDFVGNSKHKLITTVDLLGGKYDDLVVEEAYHRAHEEALESDDPIDTLDILDEMVENADELKKRKRESVKAKALLKKREIDPFDLLDVPQRQISGFHQDRPATDKQIAMLEKNGIKNAKKMNFGKANQLCEEIVRRQREGLCTVKQAKRLAGYGFDTSVSYKEATKIMDRLFEGGGSPFGNFTPSDWKRFNRKKKEAKILAEKHAEQEAKEWSENHDRKQSEKTSGLTLPKQREQGEQDGQGEQRELF